MLESFKQYPWLWLLALCLLLLAVAVFVVARRSKKTEGDSPELLLSARDVEQLRISFAELTGEKLDTVHGRELVYAVVTNLESKLDSGRAFEELSMPQQQVYTLWYFSQTVTGAKGLCQFFREFGQPLTGLIVPAVMELNEPKLAGIIDDAYNAFDETNETASCDNKSIQAMNEAFKNEFDRLAFYDEIEQFVRAHQEAFLDK